MVPDEKVCPQCGGRDGSMAMTDEIDFYEREFYPLSNFSAFTLLWRVSAREGLARFDTSEAVYQWEKFNANVPNSIQRSIKRTIKNAPSAHEAFKAAQLYGQHRRSDWDQIKVPIMLTILRAKVEQHEYVRRKLMETGDRPLIEGSWRDDFWGIGPNKDGQNMLGKLWMKIREGLKAGWRCDEGTIITSAPNNYIWDHLKERKS